MEFLRLRKMAMDADTGITGGGEQAPADKQEQAPQKEQKGFTQADIDKIINGVKAKFEKQYESKVKEIEEAQKLASMSEQEKQAHLMKEYEEKIKRYERDNLIGQYKIELTNKGIIADLAEFIPVTDAEQAKKAVDYLAEYKNKVEAPLQEKIKQLEEELKNAKLRGDVPIDHKGGTPALKGVKPIY